MHISQQAQHPRWGGCKAWWIYQESAGWDEAKPVVSEKGWGMANGISLCRLLLCRQNQAEGVGLTSDITLSGSLGLQK